VTRVAVRRAGLSSAARSPLKPDDLIDHDWHSLHRRNPVKPSARADRSRTVPPASHGTARARVRHRRTQAVRQADEYFLWTGGRTQWPQACPSAPNTWVIDDIQAGRTGTRIARVWLGGFASLCCVTPSRRHLAPPDTGRDRLSHCGNPSASRRRKPFAPRRCQYRGTNRRGSWRFWCNLSREHRSSLRVRDIEAVLGSLRGR